MSAPRPLFLRTWFVPACFAAAVPLFYAAPLFSPSASIQWDAVDVHHTAQRCFAESIASGRLPFWTPYIFSGAPFLADPQTGVWYALNWPFFLAGVTPRAIARELALHALLVALGAWLLGRRLLRDAWAAALCGVLYAFSGFFAAHSSHVGMFQGAALLPRLLWTFHRALDEDWRFWGTAGAAVAACIALGGHFQTLLYSFFALAVFAAADGWKKPARAAALLAATALAAVLLAAVQIAPGLELAAHSARAGADFSRDPQGALDPSALFTLVFPDHFGVFGEAYRGPGDRTQFYFYQGLLLLPLAAFGFWRGPRRAAALSLLAAAVWYALGPAAGLAALRSHSRGALLPAAVLAFCAADLWHNNMQHNPLAYARNSYDEIYGGWARNFEAGSAAVRARPLHRLWAARDSSSFGPMNGALLSRTETTFGYNPLALVRMQEYLAAAASNPRLLDGLAVTDRLDSASGQFVPNPSVLPRVTAPPAVVRLSAAQSQERLFGHDPAAAMLLDAAAAPGTDRNPPVEVSITGYEGDLYRIRYRAPAPAMLRIAVPWFPGWQAEVDGAPAPVFRADHARLGRGRVLPVALQAPSRRAVNFALPYSPRSTSPDIASPEATPSNT